MSYNRTVTIIVPAAMQDTANAIALALDPDSGGDKTFTQPYDKDGATYYAAATPAVDSFAETVQAILDGEIPLHHIVAANYAERWPDLTPPTERECADFLAAADIRVDVPLGVVLDELGLVRIEVDV